MLTEAQIMERLAQGDGEWHSMPNDFPDKMRAISGKIGTDYWLVLEHEPFEGQNIPAGQFGYEGTLTIGGTGHIYRLTYDVAKAAYTKGKTFLDLQNMRKT